MKTPLRDAWLRAGVGLTVVAAMALTACGPQDETAEFDDAGSTDQTDEAESTAEAAESSDTGEDEDPAQGTEEDEASEDVTAQDVTLDPEAAIETVTYAFQDDDLDGEITMGLHGLEVDDQGMLLTVSFVPEYGDSEDILDFGEMHDTPMAYLLPLVSDRENFKAYYVPHTGEGGPGAMRDYPVAGWTTNTGGQAWASEIGGREAPAGEPIILWAYFPIPEDEIDTVDIAVVPGVQEFTDIEVDWGDHAPAGAADDAEDEDAGTDTDEDEEADDE